MPFEKTPNQIPTSIGKIKIVLIDDPGLDKRVLYALDILDQDGDVIQSNQSSGNLVPHLTQDQINWLLQFGVDLRTKAESELL